MLFSKMTCNLYNTNGIKINIPKIRHDQLKVYPIKKGMYSSRKIHFLTQPGLNFRYCAVSLILHLLLAAYSRVSRKGCNEKWPLLESTPLPPLTSISTPVWSSKLELAATGPIKRTCLKCKFYSQARNSSLIILYYQTNLFHIKREGIGNFSKFINLLLEMNIRQR